MWVGGQVNSVLLLLAANQCATDEEVSRLCARLGHFVLFPAQVQQCPPLPSTPDVGAFFFWR